MTEAHKAEDRTGAEELLDTYAGESLNLLEMGEGLLSPMEKRLIRFVQHTFYSEPWDRSIRLLQRKLGAFWIEQVMRNVRRVYGETRLLPLDPKKSYLVVCNHRSFFDLYVVTSYLVYRNLLPQRILFPVRSKFFYDSPLGLAVNGAMSFFAMYPPIFRERNRRALNVATLDETARLLSRGGFFVGLHPEGQRNMGADPYSLLPARYGVGRIIHASNAVVLPVFVNGLCNDAAQQVRGNFDGKGEPVNVVFGEPVDFGDMRSRAPSQGLFRQLSQHALDQVAKLGEEEREIRARGR